MGWLIALGVFVLIAMLPVGAQVLYDTDGLRVFVKAGPVHIPIIPAPTKEKKDKPRKETKTKTSSTTATAKSKEKKKGGSIQDFLPVVDKGLDFLSSFRRKLRVTYLELKLVLAGSDPSELAVNYGKGWAILGNFLPLLEQVLVVKRRNLEVECDFLAETTAVLARMDISITVGRLILLLTVNGIPLIVRLLKVLNKRKGGAKA